MYKAFHLHANYSNVTKNYLFIELKHFIKYNSIIIKNTKRSEFVNRTNYIIFPNILKLFHITMKSHYV